MRTALLLGFWFAAAPVLADEPPVQPEMLKLQEAKDAYPVAVEKARVELLEDIDRQLASLAKAGKLDAAAEVKLARETFADQEVLPDLQILRGVRSKHDRAIRSARRLLELAYDRAVVELTRQLALDEARDLRAQKEAFLKGQLVEGLLATTTVRASRDWQTSRIKVDAGRIYEIRAVGTWRGSTGLETGPQGTLDQPYPDALGESLYVKDTAKFVGPHPTGALIARFGSESWSFFAGNEARFVAPVSTSLAFAFNDVPNGTEIAAGRVNVTVRELSDHHWVKPDGRMDVTGLVDDVDELLVTAEGLQWRHTGGWDRVGMHAGRWPTIVNGVYWWPDWPDWPKSRTSSVLPLPGIGSSDIAQLRSVSFRGRRSQNRIAEQTPDQLIVRLNDQGLGPTSITASWYFPTR